MALAFTALALTSLAMGDVKGKEACESLNIQPCAETEIYRSASNANGEKILVYRAEAVLDEEGQAGALILAMQSEKGKIRPLIEDSYGKRSIVPPTFHHIFWLDDDYFACVCSGRLRSFYALYKIRRESPEGSELEPTYVMAEGTIRHRVEWSVQDGELTAKLKGKVIMSLSY